MAARTPRTPRTLSIGAAARLLGISVQLLAYRVRSGKVRVHRRKPVLIRTTVLLDNLERLSAKRSGYGRPLGSTSTKILEAILT